MAYREHGVASDPAGRRQRMAGDKIGDPTPWDDGISPDGRWPRQWNTRCLGHPSVSRGHGQVTMLVRRGPGACIARKRQDTRLGQLIRGTMAQIWKRSGWRARIAPLASRPAGYVQRFARPSLLSPSLPGGSLHGGRIPRISIGDDTDDEGARRETCTCDGSADVPWSSQSAI